MVAKARVKLGNLLFVMGKYPERLLFHEPWLATDSDVMEHLRKVGVRFDERHAGTLSKDIIQVLNC